MMKDIQIEQLKQATAEELEILQNLMLQLISTARNITVSDLQEVLGSDETRLFVAKCEGKIIGTFSLVEYKILTGRKATVEDVVVDEAMRGKKIGETMLRFAIDYARDVMRVDKLDLTSSPTRISANALYQKLGFQKRETNIYRHQF